jgi:hypothetical protein
MTNIINCIMAFFKPTSVDSILGTFLKVQADLEAHAVNCAAKAELLQDRMNDLRAVQYEFDSEANRADAQVERLNLFLAA